MSDTQLSDKGLSILAFAAYHHLSSGEKVRDVVLDDGNGHRADAGGVAEMTKAGFLEVDGDRGRLTEAGEERLQRLLEAVRQSA